MIDPVSHGLYLTHPIEIYIIAGEDWPKGVYAADAGDKGKSLQLSAQSAKIDRCE